MQSHVCRSCTFRYFLISAADAWYTIAFGQFRLVSMTNSWLISRQKNSASGETCFSISLVNAPVPGPSSITHLFWCNSALSTINCDNLFEEATTAAVSTGFLRNCLMNFIPNQSAQISMITPVWLQRACREKRLLCWVFLMAHRLSLCMNEWYFAEWRLWCLDHKFVPHLLLSSNFCRLGWSTIAQRWSECDLISILLAHTHKRQSTGQSKQYRYLAGLRWYWLCQRGSLRKPTLLLSRGADEFCPQGMSPRSLPFAKRRLQYWLCLTYWLVLSGTDVRRH